MPPRSAAGLLQDVLDAAEFMRVRAIDLDAETFLRNEDLKVIFERKFEERLSPMLTQRQRLLEQNEQARAQLQLCGDAADTNLQLSDGQAGPRWGQALRHALGWTPEQRSA